MPDRITIPFWFYMVLLFFLLPGMVYIVEAVIRKFKKRGGV